MKKFVSAALALVMTLSSFSAVFAEETTATQTDDAFVFGDVDVTTEQGQAIKKMYESGCVAGYEDSTFRPDGAVTRAELVRIINQVFDFEINEDLNTVDFSDNANKDVWYYNDVRIAQQMGYISGFGDNTFRPSDNFTRQQACVVLTLLTSAPEAEETVTISDVVSPWAQEYVQSALAANLFELEEGNVFRATQNITRGELCVALADYIKADSDTSVSESTTEATTSDSTETTTKKSSSSGGGGGGSSSKKTTTTTEATTATASTEATTETTTTSSKNTTTTTTKDTTTTKATTTTTEATTELTTAAVTLDSATLTSLKRTARNIEKYVVPKCTSTATANVAQEIANAMQSYANDASYDVEAAANSVKSSYSSLSEDEKSEFKNLIIGYCAMSDLVKLRDTFFPGLTIS